MDIFTVTSLLNKKRLPIIIIIIISLFNVDKEKKSKNTVKIIEFTIYKTT